MKVTFLETQGDYLEARVKTGDTELVLMDEFGGECYSPGDCIDIDITAGLIYEGETWDSHFASNPNRESRLVHLSGWEYRAYGKILAINPVVVQVGDFQFEEPFNTNDSSVIGEYVAFTIDRLDGFRCS